MNQPAVQYNQSDAAISYMQRIEKLKDRVLSTRPAIDLENAAILTKSFMETQGEPLVLRKAKAFREQCRRKTVTIWEDELIVGCSGSRTRGGILSADVCWSVMDNELDTMNDRPFDPFRVTEKDKKLFTDVIKPYWKNKSVFEKWLKRIPDSVAGLRDNAIIYIDRKAVRGPGELTPGFDWLLEDGISGIQKWVEELLEQSELSAPNGYERQTYLRSLLISCEGILTLAARYAKEARRLAALQKNPERKAELEEIAQVCDRVPAHPAETFREAVQSVYLYHICVFMEQNAASYNPGRMDQYLYPFYKKDKAAGRLTDDQAQELFDCLWIKYAEPCLFQDGKTAEFASGYNMFQNACCGGIDENGQDAVNELSYMMLQAMKEVKLYQPSLSVRYHAGKNPVSFLRKIAELVKEGTGFPAIHNDEVGIKMLLKKGVTLKEAYNWNPCGCVETNLMGKLRGYTAIADVNLGSVVEFAMTDGVFRKTGENLGVRTGDPRSFDTFDDFKTAVKKQVARIIQVIVEANSVLETTWNERPVPVASLTFKECVASATDYAWGGAKYSTGNGIILDGIADFINSLSAVNQLIYEEKTLTWDRLLSALESDFKGFDDVRQLCLTAHKYGNDIPSCDDIASEMFAFMADEIDRYDTVHGRMISGILPVTAHVPLGHVVGALPSGRLAWTTLTDGLSPTGGTDVNGPTAVLKSVSRIPHDMFVSGTLLNMKLDPSFVADDRGLRNLMWLIRSMCDLGIYHVQFNVVSADTLRAAQKEPEKYRDLLIRVAGYTAYFVELGRDVQDEIIGRTVLSYKSDNRLSGACCS
ncbi:MAG: hypothetical protein K9K63_01730 [Desulfotignum sp.]|nr:hypothetical protein [Desulfotignum sp.]MCF8088206.1 hypothetical protein [Desulfotignum sp.]MCF8136011.1 hypothetical protein [Desulfotignum sp.]